MLPIPTITKKLKKKSKLAIIGKIGLPDKRLKPGDGKHGEATTATLVSAVGDSGTPMLSTSDKSCSVFHYADLKTTTRVFDSALLVNNKLCKFSATETTTTSALL